MSLRGCVRLVDLETHLKHHKILYLRTSSTNFQLVKGTSVEKNPACEWGEMAFFGEADSEKKIFQGLISQP